MSSVSSLSHEEPETALFSLHLLGAFTQTMSQLNSEEAIHSCLQFSFTHDTMFCTQYFWGPNKWTDSVYLQAIKSFSWLLNGKMAHSSASFPSSGAVGLFQSLGDILGTICGIGNQIQSFYMQCMYLAHWTPLLLNFLIIFSFYTLIIVYCNFPYKEKIIFYSVI